MEKRPILVIDDDPHSRELVTAILSHEGFEVRSAPEGESGIQLARTAQPAAILLDMMMPGVDGISTLRRLKQDPVLADIPVIGMTASTDLTYTGRAFRVGADFFLPKPMNQASLVQVVGLAVEKCRRRTPARDHRQYPRFPAGIPVRCSIGSDAKTPREIVGTASNVSLGGMMLLLPEKLAPGTVFGLCVGLPEKAIPAEGKVVWLDPQLMRDGRHGHGVQLLRFDGDAGLVGYRRYLSQVATEHTA